MPWTNSSILVAALVAQRRLIKSWELFLANRKAGRRWLTQKVHPCQRMERCSSWAEPHMQSQVLNQITFSLFFILFFFLGSQRQYLICWYCFHLCFSQIQVLLGYMWWMEEWLPQFQVNNNVLPHFRHNYAVVSKKKEGIVWRVMVCAFSYLLESKCFLFAMTQLFNYGILNDQFSAWFNIN